MSRSLEVVVLAGRSNVDLVAGGSTGSDAGCRRKVQLTVVCDRDPEGAAFGAKVSPWTEITDSQQGQLLRFGSSGLRCSFPLGLGRGAPDVVNDVRFPETAHLCVRLLVSTSSVKSLLGMAAMVSGQSDKLDRASAQLEGETRIPLTNLLSGRAGFAADRALGGWVPLSVPQSDGVSQAPPQLWLQMYVLPDHSAMVSALSQQLEAEALKLRSSIVSQPAAVPTQMPTSATSHQDLLDLPSSAGVGDLIDVDLSDSPVWSAQVPVETKVPPCGDLLFDYGQPAGNVASTSFGFIAATSAPATLEPSNIGFMPGTASGDGLGGDQFDFFKTHGGSVLDFMAPAPAPPAAATAGESSFGFIASSPASLDLNALYSTAPVQPPRHDMAQAAKVAAVSGTADKSTLLSMEQQLIANLDKSFKM